MTTAPHHSLDKSKINILLLEGIHASALEVLHRAGYTSIQTTPKALQGDELKAAIVDAHFIGIRSQTQLSAEVLDHAAKLVAVGCFCIGTNQVNLQAARDKGVAVFNAPYSNTRSVAELVLAETIMLLRGIPYKSNQAHIGNWIKSAANAYEARGKTLGIVGYGAIGTQISVLAESLGMHVIYYDVVKKLPLGNARQINDLHTLLGQSDAVTLHVPSLASTQWMVGQAELAAMKPGSILINASRGNVVVIEALERALRSKHLLGAALDVFPREPGSNNEKFSSPLQGLENVILTPHVGGSTLEAQANIGIEVAEKLVMYSDNGTTTSSVNFPEVALPAHPGRHRILHIHRNIPGMLSKINGLLSAAEINISAQYLQTSGPVGYVVIDVEAQSSALALEKLSKIAGTLRSRVLY